MLTSDDGKYHYTLVTSLSRLVAGRTRHDHQTYVCQFCLHPFAGAHSLHAHLPDCSRHPPQKVTYPKPGENTLKFDNIHFTHPVAFCLYADFECVLRPDDVDDAVHDCPASVASERRYTKNTTIELSHTADRMSCRNFWNTSPSKKERLARY